MSVQVELKNHNYINKHMGFGLKEIGKKEYNTEILFFNSENLKNISINW